MSCHLSLLLFQCFFSFPILMSNTLVFIHAGFVCVTNFISLSCYGMLPTSPFPFHLCSFILSLFNSCPIIPLSPLFSFKSPPPSASSFSPMFASFASPHFFTCYTNLYIFLSSLFLSQGSVLQATVYGLEPYSQYSLRVEAVNNAGGLVINRETERIMESG